MSDYDFDACVVGAGPNGLSAAITLAREGWRVAVFEAGETAGGGARTGAATLEGFRHDLCSAVHPLGMASPFFRELPLDRYGLQWIQPEVPLAHPLDDGTAVLLQRSVEETAEGLGRDAPVYRRFMGPAVELWPAIEETLLGPLLKIPRNPGALIRFGARAGLPAALQARLLFRTQRARALFAGIAGHSVMPLEAIASSAFAMVLGVLGHRIGWPIPRGGSQSLTDALVAYFESLGGRLFTGRRILSLEDLPVCRVRLFDTSPAELDRIAAPQLSERYREQLRRYRHGPAAFKLDWALDGPIPWKARECARAGTVHVGGTLDEIAASERMPWRGLQAERPYVIVVQPSLFDPSRAPEGKHTAWAYCHVPNGSTRDHSGAVLAQLERFAPGFSSRVLATKITPPAAFERYNPNYVGGDIIGGAHDLWQIVARPRLALDPYATSNPHIYLCSASTPPGGGVHGMCGFHAARSVLRRYSD